MGARIGSKFPCALAVNKPCKMHRRLSRGRAFRLRTICLTAGGRCPGHRSVLCPDLVLRAGHTLGPVTSCRDYSLEAARCPSSPEFAAVALVSAALVSAA